MSCTAPKELIRRMVKVSVIVPVYNVENFIEKTLSSICNQTFSDLEIILIDDGSKDQSGEICDQYAKKDSRIRVIHQENQGITKTRNTGIQLASGDYLCFVDSDDWISENFISVLVAASDRNKADIAFTNHSIVNHNQCSYRDDYHQSIYAEPAEKNELLCQIFFPAVHGKIYRRSSLMNREITFLVQKGYNGFAEDILFNFEALNGAEKLIFVPEEYYFYNRDNPNSVCALPAKQEANNDDRMTVLTKIFATASKLPYRLDISPTLKKIAEQHIEWGKEDMARKFIKSPFAGLKKSERSYLLEVAAGILGEKTNFAKRLINFFRR
ncbi:glycosyltransferase family 2 protein [uncultured Bartonella sp.]|uniref:glycosyltransferase family 2 protein n=2 Tax=uncultured Bartonella sp. TaxID=104108 RepID=UPI0025F958EC|nr:glycosyltransferase family 2 protein [uncultured Bartonella sp.]